MLGAAAGRQKYQIYLDEVKEKAEKETKRKGLLDVLDDLKSKKIRPHADIKSLQESAEEAESTGQLTCISKSNSLWRSAKEKISRLQEIEKQIKEQMNSINNS